MRVLKEIFKPQVKCARVGHKTKTITRKIRRCGKGLRDVVTDYYAEFDKCSRCGNLSEPRNEEYYESYQSCSMPKDMWDKMRESGFIIISA